MHLGSDSGWITLQGAGWEEMPYWLKGYRRPRATCSRTRRSSLRRRQWMDRALGKPAAGRVLRPCPRTGPRTTSGRTWLVLTCAQSLHEATSRPARHTLPQEILQIRIRPSRSWNSFRESWQKLRGGENLESVYWLYNRTGDAWLLDLARRLLRADGGLGGRYPQPGARQDLGARAASTTASTSPWVSGIRASIFSSQGTPVTWTSSRTQLPPRDGCLRPTARRDVRGRREHPRRLSAIPRQGAETCSHGRAHEQPRSPCHRSRARPQHGPTAARRSPSIRCPPP